MKTTARAWILSTDGTNKMDIADKIATAESTIGAVILTPHTSPWRGTLWRTEPQLQPQLFQHRLLQQMLLKILQGMFAAHLLVEDPDMTRKNSK